MTTVREKRSSHGHRALLILLGCSLALGLHAQQPLALGQLWQLARSQNIGLKIAGLERARIALLTSPAFAGLEPEVNLEAFSRNAVNYTKLGLANGQTIENNGANATSYGASLNLDWTLYSFGANRQLFARQQLQLRSSQLGYTRRENDLASEVATAYYQLVQARQAQAILDSNLAVGSLRAALSQAQYESGRTGKSDWLQAQVDLNSIRAAQTRQQLAVAQAQLALAQLLGERNSLEILPLSPLQPDTTLLLQRLMELATSQNPNLLLAENDRQISIRALNEARARRLPELQLNLGPGYLNSSNPASFVTENRNIALNYGLTASVTLWDGRNLQRQMKAAEVAADIQQLSLGEQQIAVESQLWQAWAGYTRGLDQWEITRSNIRLAAENLDIALERYRLGRASQLDLRTAQISVLQAANEELMARYTLKLYEIRMKTLAGTLAAELENLP